MPDVVTFEKTEQPDYNPKDEIVFHENPLIGLVVARLPKSVLGLTWSPGLDGGGPVYIGRPLLPGGAITRVSNPDYDYAFSKEEFKELARRFDAAAKED